MEEQRAFKFRIIAQERVYLCLYLDLTSIAPDTRAIEVVRDRDWCSDSIPVTPWMIFKGDVIIGPITADAIVLPTSEEWTRALERAQELVLKTG